MYNLIFKGKTLKKPWMKLNCVRWLVVAVTTVVVVVVTVMAMMNGGDGCGSNIIS